MIDIVLIVLFACLGLVFLYLGRHLDKARKHITFLTDQLIEKQTMCLQEMQDNLTLSLSICDLQHDLDILSDKYDKVRAERDYAHRSLELVLEDHLLHQPMSA